MLTEAEKDEASEVERLRAEVAVLRSSDRRNRAIIESSVDFAIIVTSRDGRVTDWNAGAEHILGWPAAEMLGQTAERFFTPEDRAADRIAIAMRGAVDDGRASDERWHLRQDGTRFWASGEMMPLRDERGEHLGYVKVLRDRTEQHRAGVELRQAESRLRRAQEAGGVGVFSVGADGILHATPEFCRLFGVADCSAIPAVELERLVLPEDAGRASNTASRARGDAALDVEYRIQRADTGEIRWISRKGELERGVGVDDVRFVGVVRDITDQVADREALAAEREQLAQMFEQAPTFMALLRTPEHRLERANPGFIRLVGGRETVGKTIAEALPDAVEGGFIELLDRVYRTGEAFIAPPGTPFAMRPGPDQPVQLRYVDFVYQPLRDASGEVSGIFVEGADVTSRVEAAEQLSAAEERYRTLLESVDVGFCVLEMLFDDTGQAVDYRLVEGNPAFERQTGLVGAWGKWVSEVAPGLEQHWFDTYGRVALTGEPAHFENGAAIFGRWYDVRALRVGDPNDHRVAVLFSDISERKRMESELRHLNTNLETQVQARTRELMMIEEQLRQSQKMEAVGQLTGGLAHDFNNLLTGITGSLELLSMRVAQGRYGDVERYVAAAQGAAKRAAALTHRLLAFSRRQTLDPKPTDANRLIGGMEELIRRTVGPEVEVEVVAAGGLWATLVDPNQLENALLNLCINARDAMPGGGRLTVETANRWLDERAARERGMEPGQYISLCVSDTGSGMTPDVVAKAFDPFFTTKPIGLGTGLGLSMIYGFAQQSGGQVRIYSEVDRGSTVCMYLPRHLGAAEEMAGPPEFGVAPRAAAGETVLIVDDEPTVRMLITEVLEELGYAAIEAGDATSGLRVLQSDARIDLLVTDVGLPGMNGRQMADAARVGRPDLKVLFITGYAENAVVGNGHLAPGMHVMTKPFAIDALATRIKDLIVN